MKKYIFCIIGFLSFVNVTKAQFVQGTIVNPTAGSSKLRVYAKVGAPGLTNKLFLNVNVTISIPDQTGSGGNPTDAQIVATSLIPNLSITPALNALHTANPYVEGGRAYYSYIMNDNGLTTTTTWPGGSADNQVAEFTFPSNSYLGTAQLNDLSSGGGANGQMFWYVSVIGGEGNGGDVTDYANMFYGVPALPPVNNGGSSPSFVTVQPLIVLPVQFIGFSVTKVGDKANLNWQVESEDALTDRYEVEISTTGAEFRKVATLQPLNNGRSSNSYSFTQDNLSGIRNNGILYFRIKQIDKDGKFVYSDIRNVRISGRGLVLGVYPNPVKQNAKVTFDLESNEKIALILTDASGKQVWGNQLQGVKGVNMTDINMSKFASGTYNLKLQTATESKVLSVVKAD